MVPEADSGKNRGATRHQTGPLHSRSRELAGNSATDPHRGLAGFQRTHRVGAAPLIRGCRGRPWSTAAPLGHAESREKLRALTTAISRLSRDQREVLILSVYEGLSHDEIAEIIDSTPRAVEGRLYRARQELREALADHL